MSKGTMDPPFTKLVSSVWFSHKKDLCCGPGYATPLDAFKSGHREKLLYVICVQPNLESKNPDFLATVDIDPESKTFCEIIHRTYAHHIGDELHHSGWNACSSCYGDASVRRERLIMPSVHSNRIYVVDTATDPRKPEICKVIEGTEMEALNCSTPHTSHCLANGDIMISTMGTANGDAKGDFVLLDGTNFTMKETWTHGKKAKFGYDFWYQPYHDILVASEWGTPKVFKKGFDADSSESINAYGQSINFYSWSKRELIQTIDLGTEGLCPLEIRFLHDPKSLVGFVGCALYSKLFRFTKSDAGKWTVEKVVDIPDIEVEGWATPKLPGMMSDIIISLDDKFLYFSNWLHGDVRQYDITDTRHPKLTGQIFLGGKIINDQLKVISHPEMKEQPAPVIVKGRRLDGAPQMLQLSLDGKRLYVSSSLYSPWDKQFYPEMVEKGSWIVKLDVDTERGGLKLDEHFLVEFNKGADGPVLAHEMRYPGGDCTSDIWLVK